MNGEQMLCRLIALGVFSVDDEGRIWRHQTRSRTGRWRRIEAKLAGQLRPDGYIRVGIQVDGETYTACAHRLVWLTLNGLIPTGLEINHENGIRSDNRPENLGPLTTGDNLRHAYAKLGRWRAAGERNGRSKLTRRIVTSIRKRVRDGEAKRVIARELRVSPTLIRHIVSGKLWRDELPMVSA